MSSSKQSGGEMSFLEHLDELRTRLVRCFIAIAVFFMLGWFFSDRIFNFLTIPVTAALQRQRAAQNPQVGDRSIALDLATVEAGTEIQYTFRTAVTVDGVEVPAGTTISAKVDTDASGTHELVPTRPWGVGA